MRSNPPNATPYGIMFHHFHKPGEPFGQGSITADAFADAIEFIGRNAILPAQEWYERAIAGKLGKNDICLTFDDNLMCQYDVAVPVLEQYGLTGFFFIYSSVCQGNIENLEIYRRFRTEYFDSMEEFYVQFERDIEPCLPELQIAKHMQNFDPSRYLTQYGFYTQEDKRFRFIRDEILKPDNYFRVMDAMIAYRGLTKETLAQGLWMNDQALHALSDKGHMIGLHSYSHPTRMRELSPEAQSGEYRKNFEHITGATGKKPITMSHPCNSYDASTLVYLRSLGIRLGFCSNLQTVAGRSELEFPRQDHADLIRQMAA